MPQPDLVADERPAAWPKPGTDVRDALRFGGAVALGTAVLAGRTALRRPFATALGVLFAWGSLAAAGNVLYQRAPHPAPLFARAERPEAERPVRIAAVQPAAAATAPARPVPLPAAPARSERDVVRDVQAELSRRGRYDGTVDGIAGPRTERAVRAAEASLGLPQTGRAGEALLERLRGPAERTASIAPAPAGPPRLPPATVAAVHRRLGEMGYAPGRPSAEPTPEFRRAVDRFQRDNDLDPTGAVDRATVDRMVAVTGPLG